MFSKSFLVLLSTLSIGFAQDSFGATGTLVASQSGFESLPTLTRTDLSTIPPATFTGPVVSLLLYFADQQQLVASVVSADSASTTLSVACPSNQRFAECGLGAAGMEFTQYGTTAFDASVTYSSFTVNWHCYYSGTTSAVCTEHDVQPGGDAQMTTTLSATDITFLPVTITAGGDKLSAASTVKPSGTAKGNGTANGTGSSTQPTKTGNAAIRVGAEALGLGVAMAFVIAL